VHDVMQDVDRERVAAEERRDTEGLFRTRSIRVEIDPLMKDPEENQRTTECPPTYTIVAGYIVQPSSNSRVRRSGR
jgi:hypothetical protein